MPSTFDIIQTFYINPDAVANSPEVMLSSVELYFKSKPQINSNSSGIAKPGMTAWICEVNNNTPDPNRVLDGSVIRIEYDNINTSTAATVPTVVGFKDKLIRCTPGKSYGIAVRYDDPAFKIWTNKQGDALIGTTGATNVASPGAQGIQGYLYLSNDSTVDLKPVVDEDLKFKVNVAQFNSDTTNIMIVNKPYEFFTIDQTSTGAFTGGEVVYANVANATGTVVTAVGNTRITGISTTFTNHAIGDSIVISNGVITNVLKIKNILNDSVIDLETCPDFTGTYGYKVPPIASAYNIDYTAKKVILVDSTANSSNKFAVGTRIVGVRSGATANVASIDKYRLDHFQPKFKVGNPTTSNFGIDYQVSTTANTLFASPYKLDLLKFNDVPYEGYILSRSTEVDPALSSSLYGPNRRSAVANVQFAVALDQNQRFTVPYINASDLDFFTYQNDINSTTTETRYGIGGYDTEVEKNGLGKSKYISKRISFAPDKYAEDIVVYVAGYRPAGTEIKVYAKIHNVNDKETFDDKAWSPLELKDNTDKFSSNDPRDLYEYTYGFPQYPEVNVSLSGKFITTNGSDSITTSSSQVAYVNEGDLIRVYDPLLPENHEVFVVLGVTAGAIQVNKQIDNVNIIGDMAVDHLKYKNVAWRNIANDNVARYVSTSLVEFDYYTSMQIKVVLLSDSTNVVPKVEQIQVIGASA